MVPHQGDLLEYLFEAETRPMICLDDRYLDKLQEAAENLPAMLDPVFCLDETTGSLSATFQVTRCVSATLAAARGSHLFRQCLLNAGVTKDLDVLESISATMYEDASELVAHTMQEEQQT